MELTPRGWPCYIVGILEECCLWKKCKKWVLWDQGTGKGILGLLSQSAHPPSLNTGAPGCLTDNILNMELLHTKGHTSNP